MITPRFWLDQSETSLKLTILIKYAKIKSIEVDIQETSFFFYLRPYHLRLTFPCELKSDGSEKIEYNPLKGELILTLPKKTPGEHFPDLSLISTLMQPKPSSIRIPLIEEVSSSDLSEDNILSEGYGFNHKEKGFFLNRAEEMFELFDLDPENTENEERLVLSTQQENNNWDLDRYFEDLDVQIDTTSTKELFKDYFPSIVERMDALSLESLVKVGNKNLLLHKSLERPTFFLVVEMVLCFCYEIRALHDFSCETAANINKISPGLSCLVEFKRVEDMMKKVLRRILVYGVYRNFKIAEIAWSDTQKVFKEGKEAVLRVLLKIKKLFERSEPRFLLNRIFVDDLVVWIQMFQEFSCLSEEVCEKKFPDVSEVELDFNFSLDDA
jgi:protein SHQ1